METSTHLSKPTLQSALLTPRPDFIAVEERGDQSQQRLKKLAELRQLGIDPYGKRFDRADRAAIILAQYTETDGPTLDQTPISCTLAGRLTGLRRFGKAAFGVLRDEEASIQVYFKKDALEPLGFQLMQQLDVGDWIGISGTLFRTKTNELTIAISQLTLLSKSLQPLPEKWHGLSNVETRYRQRYLDLIANPDIHTIFVQRSRIIETIRQFLITKDFLEVETPMMHPIPGGATAQPFVTHHNSLDTDLYLRIAPELYLKRLVVGGLPRIFEINRNFRNEGISTIHNPEFTMLEFYMAFADFEDLMPMTEALIGETAQNICGTPVIPYQEHRLDLTPPWRRLTFTDAVCEFSGISRDALQSKDTAFAAAREQGLDVSNNDSLGAILNLIFEATVESHLIQPTFITHYPIEISPLAKRCAAQPTLTERFELYIAGREIANAFSELNDPIDQSKRFEAQAALRASGDAEAHHIDADFIRALEYGLPPTAGEGIGIDRLVMLLTNQASIREVILFPQLRPEHPQ
tara:strand:+ start:4435 stop:5997 length:1563 start_codon:yes stop_codon:yes gene_type:complete